MRPPHPAPEKRNRGCPMPDDLNAHFVEVSAEQDERWRAAADADGLPIERWIAFTLDARAAILESRVEGSMPAWWREAYGG
jgi:hypothetical protein